MIYSAEERKKPIEHYVAGLTFKSCIDLSEGITITKEDWFTPTPEEIARQSMAFATWWTLNFHPHLNGFCGIDCIPVKCDFKPVDTWTARDSGYVDECIRDADTMEIDYNLCLTEQKKWLLGLQTRFDNNIPIRRKKELQRRLTNLE